MNNKNLIFLLAIFTIASSCFSMENPPQNPPAPAKKDRPNRAIVTNFLLGGGFFSLAALTAKYAPNISQATDAHPWSVYTTAAGLMMRGTKNILLYKAIDF